MTTGLDGILANLRKLEAQNRTAARRAVTKGAEVFAEALEKNTPENEGDLKKGVGITGFKGGSQGLLEKDIGFAKGVGYRAKFPDTGTVYQRPQNFIERSIKDATPLVLNAYADEMRKGLKL